ncbi:MAG: CHASE2 domain-containing protein [Elainellaceae cyanobacterium]
MKQGKRQAPIRRDTHLGRHWYGEALPGLIGIGIVVAARLAGLLQPLELAALDAQLRWRPPEPTDPRVTIVGVTEADIQAVGTYPIPDSVLARLLRQLQAYDAEVIGLDIARDLPVEPGTADLAAAFEEMDSVIGARTVVPDRVGVTLNPPPALPPKQIAFVDSVLDPDGHLRRSLLGATDPEGRYQFSMPLRLAETYLAQQDITLENGIRDPVAMRFGDVELPRVLPNVGGYVRADAGGNQMLINFRSGPKPFTIVSLTDVLDGRVDPALFRDRVVLVGVMSPTAKDIARTSAVASANPGLVFGVEVQAHTASQIISAVLDGRSLLQTWPEVWEYGWIILWGAAGIAVGRLLRRPSRHFLAVGGLGLAVVGLSYVGLLGGWWLPTVPTAAALFLNGVVLHSIWLYSESMRSRIYDRQQVIEQTFTAIHNGPLQTLATLMRNIDNPEVSRLQLSQELQHLNQELRSVYTTIRREVAESDHLYLDEQSPLDLSTPLHELLYEVYSGVLQRELPHFQALKLKVTTFEPFDEVSLRPEQKRDLCRLLEEMLCNVGKHAAGANRLTIECRHDRPLNLIRVIDNGAGIDAAYAVVVSRRVLKLPQQTRRGTQQAINLARQLDATFERSPYAAKGTLCELKWRPKPPFLQHLRKRIAATFDRFGL